jgi:hypothetical protein
VNARGAILIALGACAPSAAPPVLARQAPPAWQVREPGGMRPIDPGAAPDELLDAAGCARCHAGLVDEWSRSRHAVAWTNPIFRREYDARPQAWCVNCHAPLTTQQADPAGPRAAQGVDCASCHVRGGSLVSARRAPASPHATVVDASFGSPAYCADCHQFTFPVLDDRGAAVAMTDHPMQSTLSSFAAGPYAQQRDGCMTCHGSQHGHAYPGAHDPAMLDLALDLEWCRPPGIDIAGSDVTPADGPEERDPIAVTLRNMAAGHAVPTGDIHRHMYLRVWRSTAPEAMFQAFFGRRFEPAEEGGKATTWDSTLAPGAAKRFEVDPASLGGEPDEPLNLELVYIFIAAEFPRPHDAPDEPTTTSIIRRRALPSELPPCAR